MTQSIQIPLEIQEWAKCNLLHRKRPIYVENKIIMVCDICQKEKNNEKQA